MSISERRKRSEAANRQLLKWANGYMQGKPGSFGQIMIEAIRKSK